LHKFIRMVFLGFGFTLSWVSQAELQTGNSTKNSQECAAFDEVLDVLGKNSAQTQKPQNSSEINPGVMAAVAQCLIQQAASDEKSLNTMLRALNELPRKYGVTKEKIEPINRLFSDRDNQAKNAVGFFAATSMIQTAQSYRLLGAPMERIRLEESLSAISQFAERAADFYKIPSLLASETARISAQVETVSQLAALVARRDMTASIALRAKNYVRRAQQSKVSLENGVTKDSSLAALRSIDDLLSEINLVALRAMDSGSLSGVDSTWFENFDKRLISEVQRISPSTVSLEGAVQTWHSSLKKSHADIQPGTPEALETNVLVDLASDQMRSELYETTQALRSAIPRVRKEIESSSGIIDNLIMVWTSQSLATLTQLDMILRGFAIRTRLTSSPEELERSWQAKEQIKMLAMWTLEASVSKSRTANGLVSVLTTALHRVGKTSGTFLSPRELQEVHRLIQDQTSEAWVRAFVNRQMVTIYAHSALLLAEAISVPFSGGGSAAAMPATLHSIVLGLQVVGKTTLVVTSVLNISDRYHHDGVKGLINPSSALDALTIIMMLPRPIPGPVDAQTWFGRAIQNGRNQTAGWMHEASQLAIVGHAAFGAYQLTFAEHIAASLRAQGYMTKAEDVRRQALGHIAQAFLLGAVEFGEYRKGMAAGGEHYAKMVSDTNPINILLRRFRNMVFPHEAAIRAFNHLAPVIGKPLAGVTSLLPAAGYLAYDYIMASEAMMYFYAGTDFGYFSHNRSQQEYPELAQGESAVTFIGFDSADLLYSGSHSVDSQLVETQKYGEKHFVYDFSSREDFLNKLQEHARIHGPIKYLRIMTHGIPGKLYTGDVAASATDETQETAQLDGWIDAQWLSTHSDKIKETARRSMAPGARIVLFACLVGANLDEAMPGLEQKAGENFLIALGENLLPQGGLIDASVRFLIGIDSVYGGLMNWSARDEIVKSNTLINHQPILPISLFREGKSGFLETDENLRIQLAQAVWAAATTDGITAAGEENSGHGAGSLETLQYSASRIWRMMTQLHKLGIRYGIKLEGPWWSTPRYKHAKVTPKKSSEGVNVEIITY